MKKRAVQILFVSMIIGLLVFSATNFIAAPALAGPGTEPPTPEITGMWVSTNRCSIGWTCIQNSYHDCWCAGVSNGCCID